MKQNRIASLALIGILILSLVGCTSLERGSSNPDFSYLTNGFVDDSFPQQQNAYLNEADDEALNAMTLVLENEKGSMYIGSAFDVAIRDKLTGAVFFSNPGLHNGLAQNDEDRSQVTIEFYDDKDAKSIWHSFAESVGKDQATYEVVDNALQVTYVFGVRSDDLLISPVFTVETYERLLEQLQPLIDSEVLDIPLVGRFKMGYLHVTWDTLSDMEKESYGAQYPSLKELGQLYILKPNLSDFQKRGISSVSQTLGIDQAFIDEELKKVGEHSNNSQKASPYFSVSVEYRLDGRDLIVTIDPAKIYEQSGYALSKVCLTGGLGSMQASESRKIFMPDGSGSLLESRLEKTHMTELTIPFYGTDSGVNILNEEDVLPYAAFPVFGTYDDGDRAIFAIAESGESLGGVTAYPATELRTSFRVEPYFTYRTVDFLDLQNIGSSSGQNLYSKPNVDTPFVLRYHLLYGDNADYSGMARYYRTYLLQIGVLKEKCDNQYGLDIGFIGAFSKEQMKFGLQMEVTMPATTFAQASAVAKQLEESGAPVTQLRFLGALNGGMNNTVPLTANVESCLGGLDGLNALAKSSALYTAVDFASVYKKNNSLDQEKHLTRYLSKRYVPVAKYLPADGSLDASHSGFLISPTMYPLYAKRFLSAWQGECGLFLPSVASQLYSDFYEKDSVNREESKRLTVELLTVLSKAGKCLKLDGANVYSLPYAESIAGLPVENEGYRIANHSIPFIGMVLHGSIAYSGPIINQQDDSQLSVLKSIESGAALNYLLMQEDAVVLAGTTYTDLYSLSVDHWLNSIVEESTKAADVLSPLAGQCIVRHDWLTDTVSQTIYEDGTAVLVNYGHSDYTVGNTTVKAMDYTTRKVVE